MRWKLWNLVRNSRSLRLWENAVKQCGFSEVEISGWRAKLTARSGRIALRMTTTRGKTSQVVVEIEGLEGFSPLRLRRRGLELWEHGIGIEVGDGTFDSSFLIKGPIPPVCALLDKTMRRQIVRATSNCSSLEIGDGKLRADVSEEALPRVLPLLLAIGRRLARRLDVVRRLAANARHDPEAGVRLQNLLLLIREFRGRPATRAVVRTACSDQSPEIRLLAAKELGAKGGDVLLDLAQSVVDDAVSAEAVSMLGRKLPFERTRAVLDQALDSRRLQTACACLETIGRSGYFAAVDVLVKVMELEAGKVAAAAALALGATGRPAAEPPLLLALQREDTQVAAATALFRVGSVAAVLPLQEAAERSPDDQELQRATRQAIAEIKTRLLGASPGQLSLAEGEAGQLSLAEFEAGQLSLATDPAGQLSLPPDEPEQPSRNARELPFERTRALLAGSLRKPHLQTARACLEAIGKSGDPAAVDALTGALEVESELAAAAALALGATGSPAAEPPLLRALQGAKPDLQVAAATALGRVGSAAAVLPLKDAAESSPRDKDLHRAARQAVAEIQSRLQGASPGQLSMAGAEGGQLSLAQAEAGQLSLATEAGQLSLAQDEVPAQAEAGGTAGRTARKEPAARPV